MYLFKKIIYSMLIPISLSISAIIKNNFNSIKNYKDNEVISYNLISKTAVD
jgi:hypothetical protein